MITIPWIWNQLGPTECKYSIEKHLVWFEWRDILRQSFRNIIKCLFVIGVDHGQCWFILVPFLSNKFKNWPILVVLVSFYHNKKYFFLMHSLSFLSLHHPIIILWCPSLVLVHFFIIISLFFNRPTMSFRSYNIIFHNALICFLLCFITVTSHPIVICVIVLVLLYMVWSMRSYGCYSLSPFIYGQLNHNQV